MKYLQLLALLALGACHASTYIHFEGTDIITYGENDLFISCKLNTSVQIDIYVTKLSKKTKTENLADILSLAHVAKDDFRADWIDFDIKNRSDIDNASLQHGDILLHIPKENVEYYDAGIYRCCVYGFWNSVVNSDADFGTIIIDSKFIASSTTTMFVNDIVAPNTSHMPTTFMPPATTKETSSADTTDQSTTTPLLTKNIAISSLAQNSTAMYVPEATTYINTTMDPRSKVLTAVTTTMFINTAITSKPTDASHPINTFDITMTQCTVFPDLKALSVTTTIAQITTTFPIQTSTISNNTTITPSTTGFNALATIMYVNAAIAQNTTSGSVPKTMSLSITIAPSTPIVPVPTTIMSVNNTLALGTAPVQFLITAMSLNATMAPSAMLIPVLSPTMSSSIIMAPSTTAVPVTTMTMSTNTTMTSNITAVPIPITTMAIFTTTPQNLHVTPVLTTTASTHSVLVQTQMAPNINTVLTKTMLSMVPTPSVVPVPTTTMSMTTTMELHTKTISINTVIAPNTTYVPALTTSMSDDITKTPSATTETVQKASMTVNTTVALNSSSVHVPQPTTSLQTTMGKNPTPVPVPNTTMTTITTMESSPEAFPVLTTSTSLNITMSLIRTADPVPSCTIITTASVQKTTMSINTTIATTTTALIFLTTALSPVFMLSMTLTYTKAPTLTQTTTPGFTTYYSTTSPQIKYVVDGSLRITSGATWEKNLADKTSQEYITLEKTVISLLKIVYNSGIYGPYFADIKNVTFSNGSQSVNVSYEIIYIILETMNSSALTIDIVDKVIHGNFSNIAVDPVSISHTVSVHQTAAVPTATTEAPSGSTQESKTELPLPLGVLVLLVVIIVSTIVLIVIVIICIRCRGWKRQMPNDAESSIPSGGELDNGAYYPLSDITGNHDTHIGSS